MKRITYDGQSLVTGNRVADVLIDYAKAAARMDASATVDVPVLEDNGNVSIHTLLINPATSLESFDIDGDVEGEAERFPVPTLTPIGGKAVAVGVDDIEEISVPMPD